MENYKEPNYALRWTLGSLGGIVFLMLLTTVGMVGCPQYRVYSQRLEGEALLAHARSAKEVAVAEARAKMESADLLASADVKRAQGVAQANNIIGNSLKNNEAYLRYLWINQLDSNNPTIVYVPTEAGLPILEAGRTPQARPSTAEQ